MTLADIPHVGAGTPSGESLRRYWRGTHHGDLPLPEQLDQSGRFKALGR